MDKKARFASFLSVAFLVTGLACSVEKTEEGEAPDVDVEGDAGELPEYEVVKTEEGRMPDVDVDYDPGRMPEYDIEGPDIDVGMKQTKVTVPKVKIVYEEEEIDVPFIDVDLPGDEEDDMRTERVLTVKVAVPNPGYDVEIQEIYVVGDELWVVSELEDGTAPGGPVTVSDTVIARATDMPVKHFLIGDPVRISDNEGFEFIEDKSEIEARLSSGQLIYTIST